MKHKTLPMSNWFKKHYLYIHYL